MKANEYQELAGRTLLDEMPELSRLEIGLLWNAIGVAGESGEIIELIQMFEYQVIDREKWKKELGDVAWYGAACATKLGLNLEDLCPAGSTHSLSLKVEATTLVRIGVGFAEMAKKQIFHRQGLKVAVWEDQIAALFHRIRTTGETIDLTLTDIFQHNIDKLKARYPEGFDYERTKVREGIAA